MTPEPAPAPTGQPWQFDTGYLGTFLASENGWPSAWAIILAVLTIIVGWILGVLAARATRALLTRVSSITAAVANLTARIVKYAIILLAVGVALAFLGAPIQPILAGMLIVAIILALALRGIAENFAAGVVLQTRRPFRVGDEIETNDESGIVQDINARAVILRTRDGETVHVPNSLVLSEPMTNYTEGHGRRVDIEVRVAGAASLDEATRTQLHDAVRAADGIHKRPEPSLILVSADTTRATYRVRVWMAPDRYPAGVDAVTTALARAARDNGIDAVVIWPVPAPPLTPPATH